MPDFEQFLIHLKSHFTFHSLLKARWCTILMQVYKQEQKAWCKSEKRTWYVTREAVGELSTDLNCAGNPQSFLYMQHQNKCFSLYIFQSLSIHFPSRTSFLDGISIKKDNHNCQPLEAPWYLQQLCLLWGTSNKTTGVPRMAYGFACLPLQTKKSLCPWGQEGTWLLELPVDPLHAKQLVALFCAPIIAYTSDHP